MRDRSLDRQPLAALVAERPADPAWAFDDDVDRDRLARRHQCRWREQLAGTVEGNRLTVGAAGSGAYELAGKRLELDTRECNGIALQRRARPEADRDRNGDGNHGKEPDNRQQHTRRRGRRATRGLDRSDHGPSIGTRRESVQTPAESAASGLAPCESKIRGQVDALTGSGIEASLRIVGGDTVHGAAHEIVRVADEEDADVIVAGTRGHTPLGAVLLGSVTQRLLHVASCPVLVVPVRAQEEDAAPAVSAERAPA